MYKKERKINRMKKRINKIAMIALWTLTGLSVVLAAVATAFNCPHPWALTAIFALISSVQSIYAARLFKNSKKNVKVITKK